MDLREIWTRILTAFDVLFPKGFDLGKFWLIGVFLSMIMSWDTNKSVILVLFHGLCSWLYVLYFSLSN